MSCLKLAALFSFFFCMAFRADAQEGKIEGIVYDRDTKQRVARVYIYNLRKHRGVYNNIKGEFFDTALPGDTLVAATEGYRVDTITVKNPDAVLFFIKRTSIYLREVQILGKRSDARSVYEQNKKDFNQIYRKGNADDLLTLGNSSGTAGAGLSIDALWSLLSKEGKHARYLQEILERDYQDMMINYRFNAGLVKRSTGIPDSQLQDFMQQYKPSYYFILQANDYALISYIKYSYEKYKEDPGAMRVPPLPGPK